MGAKVNKIDQENQSLIIKSTAKKRKIENNIESSTNEINSNSGRKDEVLIGKNCLTLIDTNIYSTIRSVCKIIINKNESNGTGFFIKLYKNNKDFYCLMTNEHVINKELIDSKEKIVIFYDLQNKRKEIILNENKRYIRDYRYLDLDVTIIEILKEDDIDKEYFLLPYIGDYAQLINQKIFIVEFPQGKLGYCYGEIKKIKKYEITHNASTLPGSSGSPILLENTTKVIGIHKSGNETLKKNYGDFIYPVVEDDKIYIKKKFFYFLGLGKIKYDGEIFNDKFEGKGKYYYENDEYYIGLFKNGLKNGEGIEYYQNGNIKYEGEFVDDKFEGKGKYIFKNGESYKGDFKNGLFHGKGIYYYKDGNIRYAGDFIDDKFEGNGKYNYENGEYYIGQWKNDKKNSKGKYYYKDNSVCYEGDFIDDKFEGNGKYYYENGEYYIGQFKNDLRNGKGTIYYKNGNVKYDGNFINNKFEGNGTYYYEDGEYYIGQWKNDFKHGKGTIYYKEGNIKYEGDFVGDKSEGNGTYYYKGGGTYIGQWKNNLKNGKGKYYYKNGNICYDGVFIDDIFETNINKNK